MEGNVCACHHHKFVPLFIVLIGLSFLLQALQVLTAEFVALLWPVFLILAGLAKMAGRTCSCCGRATEGA